MISEKLESARLLRDTLADEVHDALSCASIEDVGFVIDKPQMGIKVLPSLVCNFFMFFFLIVLSGRRVS